jgi:hypothetical protein
LPRIIYYHCNLKIVSVLGLLCFFSIGFTQAQSPHWKTGKGTATGANFEEMREQAINSARADAMQQAGIRIQSRNINMQTETSGKLMDFYSQFTETQATGLILEERNVTVSDPVRVASSSLTTTKIQYRIECSLEAKVVYQRGEPDAGFEVKLKSSRTLYNENEPVKISVSSTRDGYVTVFNVRGDSLSVVFPNALDAKNEIKAKKTLTIPSNSSYQLKMETEAGKNRSIEKFIAVITKTDIPFGETAEVKINKDSRLKMQESQLTQFARWLYKIPLDQRSSDAIVIEVVKAK